MTAWLAKNPQITMHLTPTSGSWLNMVKIFFGIITRQAIRRGTLTIVKDFIAAADLNSQPGYFDLLLTPTRGGAVRSG